MSLFTTGFSKEEGKALYTLTDPLKVTPSMIKKVEDEKIRIVNMKIEAIEIEKVKLAKIKEEERIKALKDKEESKSVTEPIILSDAREGKAVKDEIIIDAEIIEEYTHVERIEISTQMLTEMFEPMIPYLDMIDTTVAPKVIDAIAYISKYLTDTDSRTKLTPLVEFLDTLDFKSSDIMFITLIKINTYISSKGFDDMLLDVFKNRETVELIKHKNNSMIGWITKNVNKILSSLIIHPISIKKKEDEPKKEEKKSEPVKVEPTIKKVETIKAEPVIAKPKIVKVEPVIEKVPHSPVVVEKYITVNGDGTLIENDQHDGVDFDAFTNNYHHIDGETELEDSRERIINAHQTELDNTKKSYIDMLVEGELKDIVKSLYDLNLGFDIYNDGSTINFATYVDTNYKDNSMNFSVDLNGVLYNSIPKILIPTDNKCIAENSIFIKLTNTATLIKYLTNAIPMKELKKANIITQQDVTLNKFIELTKISKEYNMAKLKPNLIRIQNSPEFKDASFIDKDTRFILDIVQSENKFSLVSNSDIKRDINAEYMEKPTIKISFNPTLSTKKCITIENIIPSL